jgi:hypothetical protein
MPRSNQLWALLSLLSLSCANHHITSGYTEEPPLLQATAKPLFYISDFPFGTGSRAIYSAGDPYLLEHPPLITAFVLEILEPTSQRGRIISVHDDGPPDSVLRTFPPDARLRFSISRQNIGCMHFRTCSATLLGHEATHP